MADIDKNTYIFDPESATEMARLINLDRFTTRAMGGPLADLPKPDMMKAVLDIACGPGGWVLDVAYAHPNIEITGIDISKRMIDYANARAGAQGRLNASFEVMDARKALQFEANTFDLVNVRFIAAFLADEDRPRLLQECMRVLRPGGILRLTETDSAGITTSLAFERFSVLIVQATTLARYGTSSPRPQGVTPRLRHWLIQAGCQDIQLRGHALDFSSGTDAWRDYYDNINIIFKAIQPLLVRTRIATQEEINLQYQNMQIEMLAEDFGGQWSFLSMWGTKAK